MNKKSLFVSVLSLGLLVSCGGPTEESKPAESSAPATSKATSESAKASSSKQASSSKETEFTATFDLNYTLPTNSLATNPTVKTENKKLTKLADPVTRPGAYRFQGWFTDKTAGTVAVANVDLTANVTYYAHWSEYTWTKGTKTGAVQAETSGTATAYTLAWADKAEAGSGWDDTHMGSSSTASACSWNVAGLPAGTYEIQISARGGNDANLNVSWWGGAEGADPDTPKYYFQAGTGDSAVKANPIKSDYDTTGLTAEGSSGNYHLSCILSEITIPADTTAFSIQCTGKGYRLYGFEYVRLITKAAAAA